MMSMYPGYSMYPGSMYPKNKKKDKEMKKIIGEIDIITSSKLLLEVNIIEVLGEIQYHFFTIITG